MKRRLFLTKVRGWDVPVGPLHFSTIGWRENALRKLNEGDWVVLAGTKKSPTPSDMRGRLLGIIETSLNPICSMDFDMSKQPDHCFKDGKYMWLFGLRICCAWSLTDKPKLNEYIARPLYWDSVMSVTELCESESDQILKLDKTKVKLMKPIAES